MSQAGIINIAGGGGGGSPIFTLTGNSGGPVPPTANNIFTVGSGSITTVGSPGTSTLTTQLTGLTNHAVLVGAGTATITKLAVGTNGQLLIGSTGADPAFSTLTSNLAAVTFTTGPASLQINMPIAQAIPVTDITKLGFASFNNTEFTVDVNGFVSLVGGGAAVDSITVDTFTAPGSNPVTPNGSGIITITGAQVATGTIGANVIRTDSLAANSFTIEIQRTTAVAGADSTKNGVSHFDSSSFAVAATGFVTLSTTGAGKTITGNSGGALSPTANNWNILGASTAAGTSPVTTSGAVSTLTVNVQTSQALASADATKIGLSNFDSSSFAVAATGFVTLSTTGAGKTITGDSGGALSPIANNWNIVGLSGSKTSGATNTLTIKSPPFSQVGGAGTSSLNSGEFVTAAVTRTLPVSAGLADGDLFIYSCTTAGALIIQAVGAQKIRIGTLLSSAAGTATSTAIGDSLTLRFDATQGFFMAVSVIGTWLIG